MRVYLERFLLYSHSTPWQYLAALVLVERVGLRHKELKLTTFNVHRLFTAALCVAHAETREMENQNGNENNEGVEDADGDNAMADVAANNNDANVNANAGGQQAQQQPQDDGPETEDENRIRRVAGVPGVIELRKLVAALTAFLGGHTSVSADELARVFARLDAAKDMDVSDGEAGRDNNNGDNNDSESRAGNMSELSSVQAPRGAAS